MSAHQISYCVDTCSLIELHRRYPRKVEVFASLWEKVEALIENGRLFSPREVLRELEKQDDDVHNWAKNHKEIFVAPETNQLDRVKIILREHGNLVDPDKETPEADPFVIALAWARREALFPCDCYVVTEETPAGPGAGKTKIPNVCSAYGIPCIRLVTLFEQEG